MKVPGHPDCAHLGPQQEGRSMQPHISLFRHWPSRTRGVSAYESSLRKKDSVPQIHTSKPTAYEEVSSFLLEVIKL
jgi:hypothetical protein